jgi:UDP-N-acetylmuramoyl-tripeptide--D-alanyl-D-alanine ligase
MMDSMSTRTGFKKVFPAPQVIKVLLLIVGAIHFYFVRELETFVFFGFLALGLEVLDLFMRVLQHRVFRPKKTTKATLITGATIGLMTLLGAGALSFDMNYEAHILTLFILSAVIGDVNSIMVFIFHPITKRMKQKVILKAKQKIAAQDVKVIGITGSYGKSSTKEFLYQILEAAYPGEVLRTPGNTNVDIGVAQVILKNLKPQHKIMVVEMGAYKKGEIRAICDIVKPEIGIITAVAAQHLALFGSLKNIQDAKYELIESLPEDGVALFNVDSDGAVGLADRAIDDGRKILTFSCEKTAKFMALHVQVQAREINFDIHGVKFTASVFGRQNLPNLLAAIAVARECGIPLQDIAKTVRNIQMPDKIMCLKESKTYGDDLLIIDDSYNANPDGVVAALNYMEAFKGYAKIFVFPGMLELGPKTDMEHIRVGKKIEKTCDFTVFTSEDFIKPIKLGLGDNYKKYIISQSAEQTLQAIKEYSKNGKIVVLFESRGSESVMEELLK